MKRFVWLLGVAVLAVCARGTSAQENDRFEVGLTRAIFGCRRR
jgi:hypothetical protein